MLINSITGIDVFFRTDIPEVGQKHLGAVDSIPTMTSDKSEDQDPGPLVKCKVK